MILAKHTLHIRSARIHGLLILAYLIVVSLANGLPRAGKGLPCPFFFSLGSFAGIRSTTRVRLFLINNFGFFSASFRLWIRICFVVTSSSRRLDSPA